MTRALGDLVQTIEGLGGLRGPPYAYYGGSAFEPRDLPAHGAMWLPGHRLATKMGGNEGTVFHANPPFRWGEQSGRSREYPAWDDPGYPDWIDPTRGPQGEYGEDLTRRFYAQPIQAREPTGWDIRTGMYSRGHYKPGDVGPSVSGLGGCAGGCAGLGQAPDGRQTLIAAGIFGAIALGLYGLVVWGGK